MKRLITLLLIALSLSGCTGEINVDRQSIALPTDAQADTMIELTMILAVLVAVLIALVIMWMAGV